MSIRAKRIHIDAFSVKILLVIMMCKIYFEIASLICCLFSTKSLPQTTLPYRQLDTNGHIAMTFNLLVWRFYSRIIYAKCLSFGPGLNEMYTPPIKSLRTVMAAADTTLTLRWFQQVAVRKPLLKKKHQINFVLEGMFRIVNSGKWLRLGSPEIYMFVC